MLKKYLEALIDDYVEEIKLHVGRNAYKDIKHGPKTLRLVCYNCTREGERKEITAATESFLLCFLQSITPSHPSSFLT